MNDSIRIFRDMDTKLTLKLDADVIARAKAHAAEHGTSVSRLVEEFLRRLGPPSEDEADISPTVRDLNLDLGLDPDLDGRTARRDAMRTKHG